MKVKNKIKQILSIIVTAMMMMSLFTVTAFAEGDPTLKIKATLETGEQISYRAYRIFDATPNNGEFVFSVNGNFNDKLTEADITKVRNYTDNSNELKSFANELSIYIAKNTGKTFDTVDLNANVAGTVAPGYYLIRQISSTSAWVPNNPIIVQVTSNTEVKAKVNKATSNKYIIKDGEVKHSTENIGDRVTYELQADVPAYTGETVEQNVIYYLTDTLSAGLTVDSASNIKVYGNGSFSSDAITGNEVPSSNYDVRYYQDGAEVGNVDDLVEGKETKILIDFTGHYDAIKAYVGAVTSNKGLRVVYSAKLNEKAVIGVDGNPNEVHLTYTNNPATTHRYDTDGNPVNPDEPTPSDTPEGTTDTPDEEVITYTYELNIIKVSDELEGEEYKKLEGVTFSIKDDNGNEIAKKQTDADGKISFVGLEAGHTYTIKEEATLSGYIYNGQEIKFTISNYTQDTNKKGNVTYSVDNLGTLTNVVHDGNNTITVTNPKGFNLPQTGGMGTWMFTIGGLVLMAGALVVFVSSRKKANK